MTFGFNWFNIPATCQPLKVDVYTTSDTSLAFVVYRTNVRVGGEESWQSKCDEMIQTHKSEIQLNNGLQWNKSLSGMVPHYHVAGGF